MVFSGILQLEHMTWSGFLSDMNAGEPIKFTWAALLKQGCWEMLLHNPDPLHMGSGIWITFPNNWNELELAVGDELCPNLEAWSGIGRWILLWLWGDRLSGHELPMLSAVEMALTSGSLSFSGNSCIVWWNLLTVSWDMFMLSSLTPCIPDEKG